MIIKKSFLILFISFFYGLTLKSQIATQNITPEQAVQDILIGEGINAFNITYNGSVANAQNVQNNIAEFNAENTIFPLENGVLMSTNGVGALNDPDINTISGGTATNGAIIEFDFIPTGDTLSFNYIFASAEYTNHTCDNFNDVFAFFLSGPGINGPYTNNAENIALVPNKNIPVSINTVNSGTSSVGSTANCDEADPDWQSNSIYFTTEYNNLYSSSNLPDDFNGGTVVLPAAASLNCQEVYHIKLAIANDVDEAVQSGVFLEARSFSSTEIDISFDTGVSINDTILIANCSEGTVEFTRPATEADEEIEIVVETSGTAVEGVDYPMLTDDGTITMAAGQETVSINLAPTNGGTLEDPLSIIISTYSVTDCGDTVSGQGTIWVIDEPFSIVTATDTTISCGTDVVPLEVSTSGGIEPYSYEWETGETETSISVSGFQEGINEFEVTSTDDCGFEYTTNAIVNLEPDPFEIEVTDTSLTCFANDVPYGVIITDSSGHEPYTFEWENGSTDQQNTIDITEIGDTIIAINVYDACSTMVSAEAIIRFEPETFETSATDTTLFCVEDNFEYGVDIIDAGIEPFTFEWENGSTDQQNLFDVTTYGDTSFSVIITDACGAVVNDTAYISSEQVFFELEASDTTIDCLTAEVTINVDVSLSHGFTPYTYEWQIGGTDSVNTVTASDFGENFYVVTVTNTCGTEIQDSARIFLQEAEPFEIATSDTSILCPENDVPIRVNITNSSGFLPYNYEWENGATDSTTLVNINNGGENFFLVTVTDDCGTEVVDSARVFLQPPETPQIMASDTIIYCTGEDDILPYYVRIFSSTFEPYEIEWENGSTEEENTTVIPALGDYTFDVTVTDACGLDTTATAIISYREKFTPVLFPLDTVVDCLSDSIPFYVIVNPDVPGPEPYIFDWSTGDTNQLNYAVLTDPGVYEFDVTVTDACDMVADTTASIEILPPTPFEIETSDTSLLCPSDDVPYHVFVTDSSGFDGYTFEWENGSTQEENTADISEGGSHYFVVTVSDICSTIRIDSALIYLAEPINPQINTTDTTLFCPSDDVPYSVELLSDGFEPYQIAWQDPASSDLVNFTSVSENGVYEFEVIVTDTCGRDTTGTAVITLNQTLEIESVSADPTACDNVSGFVSGVGTGITGEAQYTWIGPGIDNTNSVNTSDWENLATGWYYLTLEDDVCSEEDSVFVDMEPIPFANFEGTPAEDFVPLDVTFTNLSEGGDTFEWDFGNGITANVNNTDDQNNIYDTPGEYTVTMILTEGVCTDTATLQVIAKVIPPPSFDMVNVFTPNNDGANDVFTINLEHAVELDLTITNRWGNVVFETNDLNFEWNGRNLNSGAACSEGVYFYKFTVVGFDGESISEHGYVHLVRENQQNQQNQQGGF